MKTQRHSESAEDRRQRERGDAALDVHAWLASAGGDLHGAHVVDGLTHAVCAIMQGLLGE